MGLSTIERLNTIRSDSGMRFDRNQLSSPPDLRGVEKIGQYKIHKVLSNDGLTATVVSGEKDGGTGPVALKVFNLQYPRELFQRETIIHEESKNPHIIDFKEAGEFSVNNDDEKKYPTIVMERGNGSLESMLWRDGPLDSPVAVGYAFQIALGLDSLHKQDLVHADVKPSNVLYLAKKPETIVKLSDLGSSEKAPKYDPELHVTPTIAAPEQWRGEAVAESDTYALTLTLFYMLTTHAFFKRGHESHEANTDPIAYKKNVQEKLKEVPKPLHTIMKAGLEPTHENRPNVLTFANEVKHIIAG